MKPHPGGMPDGVSDGQSHADDADLTNPLALGGVELVVLVEPVDLERFDLGVGRDVVTREVVSDDVAYSRIDRILHIFQAAFTPAS